MLQNSLKAIGLAGLMSISSIQAQGVLNLGADGAYKHLEALHQIAVENDGHRAAGTLGHTFSANYIAQELLKAGYIVQLVPFDFTKFDQIGDAQLVSAVGDEVQSFVEGEEFNVMSFSASADISSAEIQAVDLELGEGNNSTSGCEAEDFESFVPGKIALVQRGACSFLQKAQNAENAGAVGVIIFNQGNEPTRKGLFGGTLSADADLEVPTFSVSYDIGVKLSETEATTISMTAETKVETLITYNVLAETPGGDAENVVMLGSHLDSVPAGAGMNDNGSGSAGILEVAIKMIDVLNESERPYNKLRFAWWSAEEVGLIGSSRYVNALSDDEKTNIAMYLNFDMIASPNYKLSVFDGDGSSYGQVGPDGSDSIEQLFQLFFAFEGTGSVAAELSGRSDYAPFAEVGIPVGGLFTGAEGTMSEEEAEMFGGVAGEAYDACYHQECDNLDNINKEALAKNTNAIAFSALTYAYSTKVVNGEKASRSMSKMIRRNQVRFDPTGNVHCGHKEPEL